MEIVLIVWHVVGRENRRDGVFRCSGGTCGGGGGRVMVVVVVVVKGTL